MNIRQTRKSFVFEHHIDTDCKQRPRQGIGDVAAIGTMLLHVHLEEENKRKILSQIVILIHSHISLPMSQCSHQASSSTLN